MDEKTCFRVTCTATQRMQSQSRRCPTGSFPVVGRCCVSFNFLSNVLISRNLLCVLRIPLPYGAETLSGTLRKIPRGKPSQRLLTREIQYRPSQRERHESEGDWRLLTPAFQISNSRTKSSYLVFSPQQSSACGTDLSKHSLSGGRRERTAAGGRRRQRGRSPIVDVSAGAA